MQVGKGGEAHQGTRLARDILRMLQIVQQSFKRVLSSVTKTNAGVQQSLDYGCMHCFGRQGVELGFQGWGGGLGGGGCQLQASPAKKGKLWERRVGTSRACCIIERMVLKTTGARASIDQ